MVSFVKTLGLGLKSAIKKGTTTKKKSSVSKMQQRLKKKQLKLQILKTDKKIFKEYLKV